MTDTDSCLVLHQHQRHRLAYDITGANDDNIFALQRDAFVFEQLQHSIWRARWEYRAANYKAADVVKVKAVDILVRRYAVQDAGHIERWWQRQLYQDAVDRWIIVELHNAVDHDVLIDIGWVVEPKRFNSDITAGADLISDIDLRGCIGANYDNCKARLQSAGGDDTLHALLTLVADLLRNSDAIYEFRGHGQSASQSPGLALDGACILDLLLVDAFGISIDEVGGSLAAARKRFHRFIV